MSLRTFSIFYYGHTITSDNFNLNFDEGGGELTAVLNIGEYSFTDFAAEIKRAMDAVGSLTYTVTANRVTQTITITSTAAFDLLITTGTQAGTSAFGLMGFTGPDLSGLSTYTGNTISGSAYEPQFILQDHIPTTSWQSTVDTSINKAADGNLEIVTFGTEKFLQCNIKYITDIPQDAVVIKSTSSGYANAVAFMQYITTRSPIEYMADINTRTTFQTVRLESTPDFSNGTGFKLKELYDKGLPGYFETGNLMFRLIE
jgi:hypothetical protein